jgi:hypothetical protein
MDASLMQRFPLAVALIAFTLIISAGAVHWTATVGTNSSSWHIYRQSSTMTFNYSSSFEGSVSPVKYHGIAINPYYSSYLEIIENSVSVSERTSAYEGKIYSNSNINTVSIAENTINITINKPSDVATFVHNEKWPVRIATSGRLEYLGKKINSRKSWTNNGDYVKAYFHDSPELIYQWAALSILERMNATVMATNEHIISADFMPTRYLGSKMNVHATGIADLSYMLRGSDYSFTGKMYPVLVQYDQRFYGSFNLSQLAETRSIFTEDNSSDQYCWLPCCNSS